MCEEKAWPWFTAFLVEADDRPDAEVVWTDEVAERAIVRDSTRSERYSILAVGGAALAGIVAMVIALIVAVYISGR